MFWHGKGKKDEQRANRLQSEAEPNTLSWVADDAAEAGDEEVEAAGEDLEEDEPFEEEEKAPLDAEERDSDDEADDEAAIARRQEEIQAELEREAEEFGLTGLNTAATFGSNGEAVVEVLDALDRIEVEDAERLADAWLAVDRAELDAVERDLRRHHREGSHSYELNAAEDAVTMWLNTRLAAEPDDADLWRIVAEAARGAVDALVLDEDLDDADYDTLYGAWADTMESDEKDEGEGEGEAPAEERAASGESPTEEEEFGPNTDVVRLLLVRLDRLSRTEMKALAEAWRSQPSSELRQAHRAARELVEDDADWKKQIVAAQGRVTVWAQGTGTALTRSGETASEADDSGPPSALSAGLASTAVAASLGPARRQIEVNQLLQARRTAVPAVVDAVTALVLGDLLEPEEAELLYRPWAEAIGEPELLEFENDGEG